MTPRPFNTVIGMHVIAPTCEVVPIIKTTGDQDYTHYMVHLEDVGNAVYAANELRPLTYQEQFTLPRPMDGVYYGSNTLAVVNTLLTRIKETL